MKNTLIGELTSQVDSSITGFAEVISRQLSHPPLGIVFYGSVLRKADPEGILDFYVITDSPASLGDSALANLANRILPPNVYYMEHEADGHLLRAKVAFLSLGQFLKRSTLFTLDSTIWARFCQPVRLIWVRDGRSADHILEAIQRCVMTASCWAALLGPEKGEAAAYWHNLFAHTYAAELRVEKKGRSRNILAGQEERYKVLLKAGWQKASLGYQEDGDCLYPVLTESAREKATRNWRKIEAAGRPLNVARLVKAAFTFSDGVSYLLWKIQRHTGRTIQATGFEKKHPVLTLPVFLWRLRHVRRGKEG